MSIPLYAYLVIIAGLYFLLAEHHWSGQAIYLHKYIGYPNIYLGIALYVWTGMLLAETRVANLTFDVLQPWKLSPYVLGWLVAVLSAVPTAYSGASGIFVIAAGKVIFDRLRASGAPRRVALGATAMSGSLGVVLRPCLIIVLIAALNKQVTTDELFAQGIHVFLLTSGLYLLFMLFRKGGWTRPASPREALPEVAQALRSIVPYAIIAVVVVGVYRLLFDMHLNEHTAAYVLPALLLGIVLFDRQQGRFPNLREPLARATSESTTNAGALLTIMAGSVGFGGIVERSGFMDIVPHDYGSPAATMALLVLVMVAVGMAMDALGAVILVSGTVAPIAYANGIDPVHFWMMALVGFELGYLHPPVGLNILLARQVAGPDAQLENFPEPTFFKRYEHFIVPCLVVGAALFVVAFVPFLWYRDWPSITAAGRLQVLGGEVEKRTQARRVVPARRPDDRERRGGHLPFGEHALQRTALDRGLRDVVRDEPDPRARFERGRKEAHVAGEQRRRDREVLRLAARVESSQRSLAPITSTPTVA